MYDNYIIVTRYHHFIGDYRDQCGDLDFVFVRQRVKHLDLFSGIGGFALAAQRVGWETVGFCEIDPYCQAVLRKHWPGVPIHRDVRELMADATGPVDIITGGYPCQPFSLAGKRGGANDDRHLWPAMFELVAALRPAWVVGENVAGHVTMGLDDVLSDLEGIGYACRAFVIPAVAVDARHRRDRLWVVAHASSQRRQQVARGAHGNEGQDEGRAKIQANELASGRQDVPDPERLERYKGIGNSGSVECPSPDQSGGCRWIEEAESGVCRVAHGIPHRLDRLRSLGNAIVPQVAEAIFRAIKVTEIPNGSGKTCD